MKYSLLQIEREYWRFIEVPKALHFTRIIFETKTFLYILLHHKTEHILYWLIWKNPRMLKFLCWINNLCSILKTESSRGRSDVQNKQELLKNDLVVSIPLPGSGEEWRLYSTMFYSIKILIDKACCKEMVKIINII